MHHFEKSILIDCSPKKAFTFHTDTRNLGKISPTYVKNKILEIKLPLKYGSEIKLAVTQFKILRTVWHIKIDEFEPYEIITDLQIKGPFKYFRHSHCFKEENGKTLMTDRIEYALPLGFLGKLAHSLFVKKMIEKQFAYRHKKTKEVLEGE